jgi:hypothetical protein
MARTNKPFRSALPLAMAGVLVGLMLAGCEEYRARRDGVTMGLGNSNTHNIAVQTVDPWPPYVGDNRIDQDGERARIAIQRYRKNKVIEPRGLSTQEINRK